MPTILFCLSSRFLSILDPLRYLHSLFVFLSCLSFFLSILLISFLSILDFAFSVFILLLCSQMSSCPIKFSWFFNYLKITHFLPINFFQWFLFQFYKIVGFDVRTDNWNNSWIFYILDYINLVGAAVSITYILGHAGLGNLHSTSHSYCLFFLIIDIKAGISESSPPLLRTLKMKIATSPFQHEYLYKIQILVRDAIFLHGLARLAYNRLANAWAANWCEVCRDCKPVLPSPAFTVYTLKPCDLRTVCFQQ